MGMAIKNITSTVFSIATVLVIIGASLTVIAYGRGYRLDFTNKSFGTTGLVAATSDPTGAQLFIDGKPKSATNTNLNIAPGWYTVTVVKNGYQPWEKRIRVQGEVLTRVDAMLFSSNPSLFALTTSGVTNPVLSPDGTKLAYVVPEVPEATNGAQMVSRAGVWVLDLLDKPLGLNRDARQIVKREQLDTDQALLFWSPDSKQLLLTTNTNEAYLLESDKLNDIPKPQFDITILQKDWDEMRAAKEKEKLLSLKDEVMNIATSSMSILSFSPDETKILYEASHSTTIPVIINPPLIGTNPTEEVREIKPGNLYVYDVKEDRNYFVGMTKDLITQPLPTPSIQPETLLQPISNFKFQISNSAIQWLPTSRHLVITSKDKVEVMDCDGTNRKTVYAGPFWDGFVAPWSNAGRLVILTNLNPSAQAIGNLYAVNIR
ncbi:MAG: Protein kinase [Candidatus Gottesmanbacteria bacterium GW2011_GWB1_44_11c]|uniref:Protein kinase n=2 Tax=Candidatus Gottesmaniibacteriota TaxID=1752720 RepID=A0A0G1KY23_9BACT|nr:MAG: Protein kinase [Candidatus Gottesmanbacteria bacterium GW2011_GWB1_44_11c]KKT61202.1 MAG: Protein kinase [Candidatus Gottesmanbacteria bacterium GW2011_GWA1_44_24b]HCM82017.1 hypothetical protein [Patescibacteria group bacterium]